MKLFKFVIFTTEGNNLKVGQNNQTLRQFCIRGNQRPDVLTHNTKEIGRVRGWGMWGGSGGLGPHW